MCDKTEIYGTEIAPLVEQITRICEEIGLPMMMAFCLNKSKKDNGFMEMTIAGSANLERKLEAPQPMILAATMLRVPGFNLIQNLDSEMVH